ncbi:MAG: hypothetical protein JRN29_06115, partial [Nitrososphaerota archaeon]|nr:hypothetical protein [Nitrososphaerota archaeon]
MDLPTGVKRAFDEVLTDRVSGSSTLAYKALEALRLISTIDGLERRRLISLARDLAFCRPTFAALTNLVSEAIANALSSSDPLAESLPKESARLQKSILDARKKMAEELKAIVKHNVTVMTLSNSGAVAEALRALSDTVSVVFVCESRPGEEGRILANKLPSWGVKAHLIPDSAA